MNIQSTKDLQSKRLTWFDYGFPGVGKTWLGSTFPKPLFAATEEGLVGLRNKSLHYVAISSLQAWKEFIDYVVNHDQEHESIILDSITALQYLIMKDILETIKIKRVSVDTPAISDYGTLTNRMRNSIEYLKSKPIHLFITGLPSLNKDETTGQIIGEPNLMGALRREMPGWLDLYTYHEAILQNDGSVKRVLYTVPHGHWIARDRVSGGKLPTKIEDPTFEKVWKGVTE